MWLFEQRGFTSTVAYNPDKDPFKQGEHYKVATASADPKGMWLLVRARVEEDLIEVEKILRIIKGDDKFSVHVSTDKAADYSFRALISREDFKAYLSAAVDDIDYGAHFKEVCQKRSSQGAKRHSAMMSIWSAMANLQPYSPYGGYTSTWTGTSKYSGKSYGSTTTTAKTVAKFEPSTKWVDATTLRALLMEVPVDGLADDDIEAMDDDAMLMYAEAMKYAVEYKIVEPLTDEQIDDVVDRLLVGMGIPMDDEAQPVEG